MGWNSFWRVSFFLCNTLLQHEYFIISSSKFCWKKVRKKPSCFIKRCTYLITFFIHSESICVSNLSQVYNRLALFCEVYINYPLSMYAKKAVCTTFTMYFSILRFDSKETTFAFGHFTTNWIKSYIMIFVKLFCFHAWKCIIFGVVCRSEIWHLRRKPALHIFKMAIF